MKVIYARSGCWTRAAPDCMVQGFHDSLRTAAGRRGRGAYYRRVPAAEQYAWPYLPAVSCLIEFGRIRFVKAKAPLIMSAAAPHLMPARRTSSSGFRLKCGNHNET